MDILLVFSLAVAACVHAQPPLSERMNTELVKLMDHPTGMSGKSPAEVKQVAKLAHRLFHGLKLCIAIDKVVAQNGGDMQIIVKLAQRRPKSVNSNTDINGPQFNNAAIGYQTNKFNYNRLRGISNTDINGPQFNDAAIGFQTNKFNYNRLRGVLNTDINGPQFNDASIGFQTNKFNYNKLRGVLNTDINGPQFNDATIGAQQNKFNYYKLNAPRRESDGSKGSVRFSPCLFFKWTPDSSDNGKKVPKVCPANEGPGTVEDGPATPVDNEPQGPLIDNGPQGPLVDNGPQATPVDNEPQGPNTIINGPQFNDAVIGTQKSIFNYFNTKLRQLVETSSKKLSNSYQAITKGVPSVKVEEAVTLLAQIASSQVLKVAEQGSGSSQLTSSNSGGYTQMKKMCIFTPGRDYCVEQKKGF